MTNQIQFEKECVEALGLRVEYVTGRYRCRAFKHPAGGPVGYGNTPDQARFSYIARLLGSHITIVNTARELIEQYRADHS